MWSHEPCAGLVGFLIAAIGIAGAIVAICLAPLWLAIVATLIGFVLVALGAMVGLLG